ncbi:unnamed protein product [Taenia asiatica]|uniref:IGv domain-containing protein n=1 Tax=Taenia asiatica TaxID=60517 RepID=A0A0R3W7D7_TAEAS|nr:unnamed protein product [Taenia asiatica]
MRRLRRTLLVLIVLRLASAVDPLGSRSATITETGEVAIFEWYQQPIANKSQAIEFCELHGSSVPEIRELRYFFKSLTLQNGSIFYLNDVMETTVDSPNEAIGERMCVTVKNSPGHPLQLGETSAVKSCSTRVNANVCRRTTSVTNSTLYMKCLEVHFKETKNEAFIKLDRTSFYIVLGAICLVLLVTNCLWITFCYKYCSTRRRTLGRGRTKSSALFAGSEILKPISLSPGGSDLGRYDLLPDVPLQRGESCRRSRRSSGRRGARTNNPEDGKEIILGDSEADHKPTEADATGFL